jgi:hypothetical protein
MAHITGDITIFSIDGLSQLDHFENVTLNLDEEQFDASSITREGKSFCMLKKGGTISTGLMSDAAVCRVTHLDLSALTVTFGAALNILSNGFGQAKLSVSYDKQKLPNTGELFRKSQNTNKTLAFSLSDVPVNDGVAFAFAGAIASTDKAACDATIGMTTNGITFTIPMRLKSVNLPYERDGLQVLSVEFVDRAPATGAYPTAPTGTTTLIEKAINAYKVAYPFSFRSKAGTGGIVYTGNMIFTSLDLTIDDGSATLTNLEFETFGAVTVTATT